MFREVVRIKRRLPEEETIRLLKENRRGVLSVQGDDGYPYGVPINYWYDPVTGHLFFHGGKTGHRIDAIRRCDKVSFCVFDEGTPQKGTWALLVRSAVVFGRIREVTDPALAMESARMLSRQFPADEAYIEHEIEKSGPYTLCLELCPEHITGKIVEES